MDKLLGALSLAKKAGKLACGYSQVMEAAPKRQLYLLLFASNYAEKSRKRLLLALAESPGAPAPRTLPYTQFELAAITRKEVGVLAVTDKGLAGLCEKLL